MKQVRFILIDPTRQLTGGVRADVLARLERDFAALKVDGYTKTIADQSGLKFAASYVDQDPTEQERRAFCRLDYPIYLYRAHTSDGKPASLILTIMRHHGILERGLAGTLYAQAEAGWKDGNVEGLGIPPLMGYRKVGFVKADTIAKLKGDLATIHVNIIKHELGHMFGLTTHDQGIMRAGVALSYDNLDYTNDHRQRIHSELGRLAGLTEAQLQGLYERANR
jgi:hypothetical protein